MAMDPASNNTVNVAEEEADSRASRLSPDDLIAPTCMFWAMLIGLGIFVLMIVTWAIPHLGTIINTIGQ